MKHVLNFISEGNGFPVVFIHGFCESSKIWETYKRHFSDSYQTICIDLPGHGESEGIGPDATVDEMAHRLKNTLDSANITKPVLVGHSLGGYVAVAFAKHYPDHLSGFCFFHSSAFEDSAEKKENRNKTARYVQEHGTNAFINPFVPGLFYQKNRESLKEAVEFASEIGRKMNVNNIADTIIAMRDRKNNPDVLAETNVPVGFIVGKNDTAVPLEKSIEQCHLPKLSSVIFLDNTGHMGMFEKEQETADFLKGFFSLCINHRTI